MNQSYTVWLELQVVTQNARIPSRLLGLEVFHISLLPAKSGDVFVPEGSGFVPQIDRQWNFDGLIYLADGD